MINKIIFRIIFQMINKIVYKIINKKSKNGKFSKIIIKHKSKNKVMVWVKIYFLINRNVLILNNSKKEIIVW